jgi:hypothetical protein
LSRFLLECSSLETLIVVSQRSKNLFPLTPPLLVNSTVRNVYVQLEGEGEGTYLKVPQLACENLTKFSCSIDGAFQDILQNGRGCTLNDLIADIVPFEADRRRMQLLRLALPLHFGRFHDLRVLNENELDHVRKGTFKFFDNWNRKRIPAAEVTPVRNDCLLPALDTIMVQIQILQHWKLDDEQSVSIQVSSSLNRDLHRF